MRKFLLLLAMLFAFGASAEAGARLNVKKSADQPEVTAVLGGQVFAQFTTVEVTGVKKGKMALNNIRIEICSDGKFGVGNTPTIGEFFKKVCLIANTSPGNSATVERTLVTSLDISDGDGFSVDLLSSHWFGDNAKFTVVGIPRDEALYSHSGETIGLAVIRVDASDKRAKKARVLGRFPVMGTEQIVNPNAWVGAVYVGKTDFYYNGNIYPAICVWGTSDVVVKKLAFRKYLGKDAKIIIQNYSGNNKEYDCLVDGENVITACNFYTAERELSVNKDVESLSAGSEGIYLPAGSYLYVYSPNNSVLFNHLVDLNDIVVVGAYMNYRYAPQWEDYGKACFLAGTMVKMSDGKEKPIEDIKIGDSVWVGEGKSDKVKGIIKKNDPEWLCIVAGNRVVLTVPDQLFFVVAQEADGKPSLVNEIVYPATMIKAGDMIKNDKREFVAVTAVSHLIKGNVPTWDLVLRNRTFYYADGFKVHSIMDGRNEEQLSALSDH